MITVVHPSRGRADKAHKTKERWMSYAVNKDIQWLISLDEDDPFLPKYKSLFDAVIINNNSNLVQAVNAAIPKIDGDLVIVVSDDFDCPQRWDEILKSVLPFTTPEAAIYVNDGLTWGQRCMTLPILTKSLIDKLGYIYYPRYSGLHADNDLYEVCEKLGVIVSLDIIFQHNHYTTGKTAIDNTYKRHNTKQGYDFGSKMIQKRRAENFNL